MMEVNFISQYGFSSRHVAGRTAGQAGHDSFHGDDVDSDSVMKIGRTLAENIKHVSCDNHREAGGLAAASGDAVAFGKKCGAKKAAARKQLGLPVTGLFPVGAARKKHSAMRINETLRLAAYCAIFAVSLGWTGGALAFDDKNFDNKPGVKERSSPWTVFRSGFSAYKKGHKEQAVEAYKYAAEMGQLGATWKLARMYAEGDGVVRDDYEAFKFFSEIAQQDVEPGSPEESYVSDALVALGGYMKSGIPGSPVVSNAAAAQEYYMRAATTYRNPNAQFEVGKMFLKGEGGVKASVKQAGRWLQLAAEKGHSGAQATLGHLLFQSGKVVRGLAMMTAALARANSTDRVWIGNMQEEAFALAPESERRTAVALAQDMLNQGDQSVDVGAEVTAAEGSQ